MRRRTAVWIAGLIGTACMLGCGAKPPTVPTPSGGGNGGNGSGGGTVNTPPVVQGIVAGADAHAEVGTPITLTATVTDAETPLDQLTYTWSAPTGTFSGSGSSVAWTPGADAQTPADVTVTLTVTEKYGSPQQTNTATGTVAVHVNNSPKELAELS